MTPTAVIRSAILDLFLILTALLCALTGATRTADARMPSVQANCVVGAVRAASPTLAIGVVSRPAGYVLPQVLVLDLDTLLVPSRILIPERRRE